MAKKRKGRRKPKPSLIMLLGLGVAIIGTWNKVKSYGKGNEAAAISEALIGYRFDTGTFNWKGMTFTLPLAGAAIAKKALNMVGVGRAFRGLPVGL